MWPVAVFALVATAGALVAYGRPRAVRGRG
jgi:hypothetical protein